MSTFNRRNFLIGASAGIASAAAYALLNNTRSSASQYPESQESNETSIYTDEADFILSLQSKSGLTEGAINNVPPKDGWTWVVPRENGMAIYGLVLAAQKTENADYLEQAEKCCDFLTRIQNPDGSWNNQYPNTNPWADRGRSPTQPSEVMMAYHHLNYENDRTYQSMIRGAEFLISLQNEHGLITGGYDANNNPQNWCWITDNCYAYKALIAAAQWTSNNSYANAADKILQGINKHFYIPETGIWHVVVDGQAQPQLNDPSYRSAAWLQYSPQMLGLENATGYGDKRIGEWMHKNLQDQDTGAVRRGFTSDTMYEFQPGLNFQAAMTWKSLGQTEYATAAITWAYNSKLYHPDGGWIDWYKSDTETVADDYLRFPDTSFYHMAAIQDEFKF